jgi:hypothetical protein
MLTQPDYIDQRVKHTQVNEDREMFLLFFRYIGALHDPGSYLSIDSQLQTANEVFTYSSTSTKPLPSFSTSFQVEREA